MFSELCRVLNITVTLYYFSRPFKKPSMSYADAEITSHSIVISYVHHEATSYAQDLKKELLKTGFKNVFLVSF